MGKPSVMPWVDLLPNVASTTFQDRRNQVRELVLKADEFVLQADELVLKSNDFMQQAAVLRAQAHFTACSLESDIKKNWPMEVIEKAKHGTW